MKVQIAGIRTVVDAKMCAECGVDIIGLLVGQRHESFEFISKELAREMKQALPHGTETTLITHLEEADEIIDIAKFIGVNYVQLHSYIVESEVEKIHNALPKVKLIRLIHISSDGKILNDISKIKYVDYYFTDSINVKTNQVGGTGLTHDFTVEHCESSQLHSLLYMSGVVCSLHLCI